MENSTLICNLLELLFTNRVFKCHLICKSYQKEILKRN